MVLALFATLLPLACRAQTPVVPAVPYYAMDPRSPLTPRADSPVQQQVLENYRSQLRQTQHELSLQNPAGTAPAQFQVNSQLNSFAATPPPVVGVPSSPMPGLTPPPK